MPQLRTATPRKRYALRRELKYGEPAEQLVATRARLLLGDEIAD
jgi:hypothetical protein